MTTRRRASEKCTSSKSGTFIAVLLLVLGLTGLQGAQATPSTDTTSSQQKYWIFLEERPHASPLTTDERWVQPVAPSYVKRLRTAGIRPLVRSRWLHAVSARLSGKTHSEAADLPFVRRIQPVAQLAPARTSAPGASAGPLGSRSGVDSRRNGPIEFGASRGPLSRINARAPLERGLNGHGVRVGFLDAHFNGLRHPAFSTLRRTNRLGGLRNFTSGRQGGNHGVGVASVAVGYDPGRLVGPAYGATVFGATTEFTQFERNVEEDNFVAGLEWLHRQGVDVVNVSIGYTRFDEGERSYSVDDLDGDTGITTRAVDRAAQLGVTVIVSAGNSGCDSPDACWYYVNTPADADSAITVGAVTPDSSLAPFSSRGPTADGRRKPDVVVQGREVAAAWDTDRYARVEGTSFASPQVTGVAAQMLQVNPSLEPMQVRQLLRQTASQSHAPDTSRGWGVVNADAAVRAAEWHARRSPPSSLEVSAPYSPIASADLIVPVTAPAQTSTLRVSFATPAGRPVHRVKRIGHPGPNWIAVDPQHLSPGLYRYQVHTDTGHRASGRVTITE